MGIVICVYIVMIGMCFGSFLNVVATRAVEEKELFGGRKSLRWMWASTCLV